MPSEKSEKLQKQIDSLYIRFEAANVAFEKDKSAFNANAVAMLDAAIDELIDKQIALEKIEAGDF